MTSYKNSDPRPPIMAGSPPPPEWRVPRAAWDSPPWNRWTFMNVRQVLPTVNVPRGPMPVAPLTGADRGIGAIEFTAVDGTQWRVDRMLDETYTDGFLMVMDGEVIHESYHNGMRPDSLHLSQSVAKSVVSTVTGILIGQGLMDVNAPVTAYLPELAATAWNGATIQHLLDMASGVKFDETYTSPDSDIAKTDVACGWKPMPDAFVGAPDWPRSMWDQILSMKQTDAAHGARFEYRSIETDVLAHAMERASGRRLAQLVSDELWSKIGAEHDACFTVDSAGYALADGGFNASLRDYARFGLLHLNGGLLDGQQIIPAAWIDDIRRGPHGLFNASGRELYPNGVYRNQFWVEDASRQTVLAAGVFGQLIYIAPEYNMVVVKMSTWPDFLDNTHKTNTLRAIHAVARALGKT